MIDRERDRNAARRLAILRHAREVTGNVSRTCRYYGITRQAYYTWLRRYEELGLEGLRDQATVPWQQDRQIGMESFLDPRPLVNELVTVVDEELQIATGPFGRNRRKLRLSSYNTSDRQRVSGVRLAGPPSPPALFVGQHRRNLPDVLSRPFKCSGQPGPETTSTLNSEPTPFTDRPRPPEWVDVIVDRWRTKALIRPDLPLSAEGWFELLR